MNEHIKKTLIQTLFYVSDQMTYSAYCKLYDSISNLDKLLKAQEEPVQPHKFITGSWLCGACRKYQVTENYCPGCGRKVDWSEVDLND